MGWMLMYIAIMLCVIVKLIYWEPYPVEYDMSKNWHVALWKFDRTVKMSICIGVVGFSIYYLFSPKREMKLINEVTANDHI